MAEHFENYREDGTESQLEGLFLRVQTLCESFSVPVLHDTERIIVDVDSLDGEQREELKEQLLELVGSGFDVILGTRSTGEDSLPKRLLFIAKI